MLENCNADVIIVNSVTESFILKEIKKHTKASAVGFVRETLPKGNKGLFFQYFKKRFEKYADGVFFISDFDRLSYNLEIRNAITVKNTVPDDFFEEYEDTKSEYLAMLNVAREPEPISILSVDSLPAIYAALSLSARCSLDSSILL